MSREKLKVVCVLYDDPVEGYPKTYARDSIPKLEKYPDGQTMPSPENIDFTPGQLLGSVSGELGLRKFLEERGHTFIVTSSKDGDNSVLDKEIIDADVVMVGSYGGNVVVVMVVVWWWWWWWRR